MGFEQLILFCGGQTLILLLILLQKRFRTTPNLFLFSMLILLLGHYTFFYFIYSSLIPASSPLTFLYPLFGIIPPVVIYYYGKAVMHGKVFWSKQSLLHGLPLLINLALFLILLTNPDWKKALILAGYELMTVIYLFYPFLIVKKLCDFYHMDKVTYKVFSYNLKKTSMIRLLIKILFIHGIILVIRTNLPLIWPQTITLLDIANLIFLLVFSYILTYVIISVPQTIHYEDERVGLAGFKKYEKSNLTREKASHLVSRLNDLMLSEKPFLNPNLNLSQLAALVDCSSHTVSETLNGLIGQSFNDYINNFRIEEFKSLATQPKYHNYTILALAFEVGFKSKATFNAAFKKFTGQTPSQFLKTIR
ncbi:AraC family transcriptional regulator [Marinilabiliaceae bacterium JC017]|nr:AraC family transcriptional regulator [Marinilabiliaceae bacterium JC017]